MKKKMKGFFKVFGGAFFLGLGVMLFGISNGDFIKLISGVISIALGMGIIFMSYYGD